MSELLGSAFARARAEGRAALVPYLTAGFPDRAASLAALRAADQFADILEVGVPFSDPLADGPTIQRASHQALAGGMTLAGTLELIREAELQSPVVLFTYLNPVLRYGLDAVLAAAPPLRIGGLLLTDLPAGADGRIESAVESSGVDLIRLVAPTTPDERLEAMARDARGFLYLVARLGVTGARASLASDLARQVARVRAASPLPVAVGFGISTPEQAHEVAALADGVVVGSAVVDRLEREGPAGVSALLASLRASLGRAA